MFYMFEMPGNAFEGTNPLEFFESISDFMEYLLDRNPYGDHSFVDEGGDELETPPENKQGEWRVYDTTVSLDKRYQNFLGTLYTMNFWKDVH